MLLLTHPGTSQPIARASAASCTTTSTIIGTRESRNATVGRSIPVTWLTAAMCALARK